MATLTAEQVDARLGALENQVAQISAEFQAYRAEHGPDATGQLRREIEQLRVRLARPSPDFRLVDPRSMVPEIFDDSGTWQVWCHKAKSYVGLLGTSIPLHFTAVEACEDPVTEGQLAKAGFSSDHEDQLQRFLLLRTAGIPHQIVKGAQAESASSLEIWRRLANRYDPKGLGSELLELQELTSPEKLRAKTVDGISAAIQSWETLERRHADRQGLTLPDKVRISVLLKLVPPDLTREICRQTTRWSSYAQLKDHLQHVQYCRSTGAGPMVIGNTEFQSCPEEVIGEDGEVLRLERRDGKTVAVRAQQPSRPWNNRIPTRDRQTPECFRCGRLGHIARNCTATAHKNGGPCKPPPVGKKTTANLEEVSGSAVDGSRQLGHLELNALEGTSWQELFLAQAEKDAELFLGCPAEEDEWVEYLEEEERKTEWAEHNAVDPWAMYGDPWSQFPREPVTSSVAPPVPEWTKLYDCSALPPLHLQTPWSEVLKRSTGPSLIEVVGEPNDAPSVSSEKSEDEPEVLEWTPTADAHCQTETNPVSHQEVQTEESEELAFHDCREATASDILAFDLDVGAIDRSKYREVKVTMDSGASEPVADPETFPGVTVSPSEGSRAGRIYLGPGGERIPNEGEIRPRVIFEDDVSGDMKFNAARVRKPLMAVSSVNDKGHMVLFDQPGSFMIPASAPELEQIRALVQQAIGKVQLHREGGVFHLKTWVFPRPGK